MSAVTFDRALELENAARAALAFRKRNRRRLLRSFGRLEPFELVELLDAALHEARLARLVAEAADEAFHVLDFFALPLVRRHLEREAFLAQHEVARIAANVLGEPPARHFDRAGGDAVEKIAVMRDEDDPALVRDQVIFEPVARLDVEMVGRLVEHHEVGRVEQEFRQRDTHPDAAGKFANVAPEVFFAEAQAEQHRGGTALGAVKVMMLEFGQHLAQFLERGVVRRSRMLVRENLLDFLAARIERLHPIERRQRLAQH